MYVTNRKLTIAAEQSCLSVVQPDCYPLQLEMGQATYVSVSSDDRQYLYSGHSLGDHPRRAGFTLKA
jgi:hypothetical protein